MNTTDQDRLDSKMQSATVVNLDDYRSKGADNARSFTEDYLTPATVTGTSGLIFLAIVLLIAYLSRR